MQFEDDIDKLFKDKLSGRKFEIEDNHITNIEVSLNKKKGIWTKMSFGPLSSALVVTLVVTAVITAYFLFSNKKNTIPTIDQTETTIEVNKSKKNTSKSANQKNDTNKILRNHTNDITETINSSLTSNNTANTKKTNNNNLAIKNGEEKERLQKAASEIREKNKNNTTISSTNSKKNLIEQTSENTEEENKKQLKKEALERKEKVVTGSVNKSEIDAVGDQNKNNSAISSTNSKTNLDERTSVNTAKKNQEQLKKEALEEEKTITDTVSQSEIDKEVVNKNNPSDISSTNSKTNLDEQTSENTEEKNQEQLKKEALEEEKTVTDSVNQSEIDKGVVNKNNSSGISSTNSETNLDEQTSENIGKENQEQHKKDTPSSNINSRSSNPPSTTATSNKKDTEQEKKGINTSDSDVNNKPIDSDISDKITKPKSILKKWSVSLFSGMALINKNISSDINANYVSQRRTEETNINSVSYGVEVGYFFNKNLNMSLGLNSMTYGEDVNYNISRITMNTTIDTVYGDSNQVSIDTVSNTVTSITNESNKNRYTYFHIPIMLGYRFNIKKIGLNVKFGGSYAISKKYEGKYINTNLDELEQVAIKSNMLNFIASTAISYPLKRIEVFVEPKYQFQSSNVFNNNDVKQSYSSFGLNLGLSVKF